MKKYLKYVECFLLFISFCLIVYASQEEIDRAKEAMEKYCQKDETIKGCIYDENDSLYTHSGRVSNTGFWVQVTTANLPLRRGYVSADGNGNILFAGCYKGHMNAGDWVGDGDYFVFKIVRLDGGKCKQVDADIVFAKGTKYKRQYDLLGLAYDWAEFDGNTSLGETMATYKGWTAVNNGECPIGFGLIANTKWYTSKDHTYVFANDASGFNIGVTSFFGGEKYVTTPGCTVQDTSGHDEAEACFNEASNKIKNEKCPSDFSELSKLSSTLKGYQDSCDNKFRTLYSKGLLESDAKEMKEKLVSAVNDKLSSCQASQCNVTASQLQNINNTLTKSDYKDCKTGMCKAPKDISAYQKPGAGAKCYRIGNGWDAYFEWTATPSGQPATEEPKISQSECYGTYTTRNCRSCLKNAYKAAGLSDKQINCMLNIEAEKSQISQDSEKEIEQQFEEKTEEKLQENDEIRQQVYKSYEKAAAAPDVTMPGEDPNMRGCEKILGPNLTAIVKVSITILQIVGAIIAIVKGMMVLIPPILAKDADALKKASKTLITMAIILVIIFLFRPILTFIGNILDFDTSCIV